jgi:hypothetical protein
MSFIVDLLFKDNANLYLCLEFIGGGEVRKKNIIQAK